MDEKVIDAEKKCNTYMHMHYAIIYYHISVEIRKILIFCLGCLYGYTSLIIIHTYMYEVMTQGCLIK